MGSMQHRLVGGGLAGGVHRAVVGIVVVGVLTSGCGSDEPAEPTTLVRVPDAAPGDLVGLAADDERRVVSWLHRTDGTIHELSLDDDAEPVIVGTVDVSTDSQQGGLLDQAVLSDGSRLLAWTDPDDNELVVGRAAPGERPDTLWSSGRAGDGAIGGRLDVADDGSLLVALGRNTRWQRELDVGGPDLQGVILRFVDTDGLSESEAEVISTGYTNPWAYEDVDGAIWVWDNAAGPDPDDPSIDDVERIGRADLVADRNDMTRSELPDRAPAAMIELPDGRLGICGFLDNELRSYEIVDGPGGPATALERAGTIMPCNTGAAVFADGTIVTAAQTVVGESLQILRP